MTIKKYFRMSIYYLLFFATTGVFQPYFNLYLSSRGFSSEQVGFVLAVIPFIGMLAQPMWGIINDRFYVQKGTLLFGLLIPSSVLLFFPYFHSLALYLGGAALIALFQTPMPSIADSMTIQNTSQHHYGKVRLFGSLGYAATAAASVIFFNRFGISIMPYIYFIASLLVIPGLIIFPKPSRPTEGSSLSIFYGAGQLLRNRHFILILCFAFFVSVSQAVNGNFFALYYQAIDHPLSWLGIIFALGAISELPFFFIIGKFIGKYGPERIFILGGSVFLLRWIVLSFEPPTWLIISMQLMHGLSFSLIFSAGVAIAAKESSISNRATAQTLYSSVNMGLSAIVGSLAGGVVFENFGPRGIYEFAAFFCFIGITAMCWLIRKDRLKALKGSSFMQSVGK